MKVYKAIIGTKGELHIATLIDFQGIVNVKLHV